MAEKRCYTVNELQEVLGVSRPTVYNLLKKNEFRWIQLNGGKYHISKKSFDDWLDNLPEGFNWFHVKLQNRHPKFFWKNEIWYGQKEGDFMDREEILNTKDYDSLLKEVETNSPYKRLPYLAKSGWFWREIKSKCSYSCNTKGFTKTPVNGRTRFWILLKCCIA